ncbi:MAG TPA: hypothetical protein VNH11_27115 [Pirellulales bacterium]|nr:hypothetical protein [Pirellulales bacterium]
MNQLAGPPVRVVKLGGSLLDLADLADRLRRWLGEQPAAANVLVVGGGRMADVVRDFDRRHGLRSADAHWLAIAAMALNARLVAALLPEALWLESLLDNGIRDAPLSILNPARFLREDEAAGSAGRLPMSWQATSDSIAARAAELLAADELVLLKSTSPPEPATVEVLLAAGYVDAFFAKASGGVARVRYCNLRDGTS